MLTLAWVHINAERASLSRRTATRGPRCTLEPITMDVTTTISIATVATWRVPRAVNELRESTTGIGSREVRVYKIVVRMDTRGMGCGFLLVPADALQRAACEPCDRSEICSLLGPCDYSVAQAGDS